MKKSLALLMATLALGTSVLGACGGPEIVDSADASKTTLRIANYTGGVGEEWLEKLATRFEEAYKDEVFETGKKGVAIIPSPTDNPSLKNAETSGSAIFDLMGLPNIENDARAGNVLMIDDVITEKSDTREGVAISPLEKISEDQRSRYMYDGHYYGGPTCEYYPTINYDRNLFDRYQLYFVNSENVANCVAYDSEILCDTYYPKYLKTLSSKTKTNDY